VNLENVTRDDWIVGGLALVLAIFLLVLPWFDLSVGPFSATLTATDGPDGWLGILAVIAALAVVADLAIERLSPQTEIPALGDSRTNTRFILAAVAAGFVALKFLFHIHFDLFGWGFYVNVILTAALVYVAYQARAGAPIAIGGLGGFSGGSRRSRPSRPSPPPAAPPSDPAGTPPSGSAGTPNPGPGSGSTPPPGS
jgi:hypothetical protein